MGSVLYLYAYNEKSNAAKALSRYLLIQRIRHDNSAFKGVYGVDDLSVLIPAVTGYFEPLMLHLSYPHARLLYLRGITYIRMDFRIQALYVE